MNQIIYKYNVDSDELIMILSPLKQILLSDTKKNIIEYNIKIIYNKKELETTIHYYISDGQTNGLNAKLLLPMLYINTNATIGETSLDSKIAINGILKNRAYTSLNFSQLSEFIFNKTYTDCKKITPECNFSQIKFNDKSNGLYGILNRIPNLLDIIICLNLTEELTDDNWKTLRPQDIFYDPVNKEFDDIWRINIIIFLNILKKEITSIFTVEYRDLEIEKNILTSIEFNAYLNLFDTDVDIEGTLADLYKTSQQIYHDISKLLHDIILKEFFSDSARFEYIQYALAKTGQSYAGYNNLTNFLKLGYRIDVKQKYLKYKQKYFDLKKNIFFGGAEAGPTERYNSFTIKYQLIKLVITPQRRINLDVHNRMVIEYHIEKFIDGMYTDASEKLHHEGNYISLGSDTI